MEMCMLIVVIVMVLTQFFDLVISGWYMWLVPPNLSKSVGLLFQYGALSSARNITCKWTPFLETIYIIHVFLLE